jgi:hypothetical protein
MHWGTCLGASKVLGTVEVGSNRDFELCPVFDAHPKPGHSRVRNFQRATTGVSLLLHSQAKAFKSGHSSTQLTERRSDAPGALGILTRSGLKQWLKRGSLAWFY